MPSNLHSQFFVQIISIKNVIRSENLESKLTGLWLKFQISPGVVPNETDFQAGLLHSSFVSKLLCQRNLSIGEVGCALAHRNAMHNFLNSNHKFGIIFEDDTEIIADFDFDIMMQLLDSNLSTVIALGWTPGFAIAKTSQDISREEPIELVTSQTGAFAYAINRPAAKLMVSSQEKIIDFADWPICTVNKVKFYAINPHSPWVTTNYDPELSTIGEREISISNSAIKILVGRIRLATSLLTLMLVSKTNKLNASPKQIVQRLLIRDLLYKNGTSQVDQKSTKNEVVPITLKFQKMLTILRLI